MLDLDSTTTIVGAPWDETDDFDYYSGTATLFDLTAGERLGAKMMGYTCYLGTGFCASTRTTGAALPPDQSLSNTPS